MNWTRLWMRLRGRPAGHEAGLDEELEFHAEMKRRELAARGLDPRAAREQARRDLGNLTLAREEAREAWSIVWLSDAWHDVKYGARTLKAQPGFALAAVVALVLGIGVNAILFSVYNAVALAPFAIRDPGATVQVFTGHDDKWGGFSWPEYRYLRSHTQTLTGLVAYTRTRVRFGQDETWADGAGIVSENFFDVIGTGFAAGRGFSPEAGRVRDPAPEVVLHHDTWRTRFGADPQILGQWINISGHQLQVVGVAAQGFAGPSPEHLAMWLPGAWRDILEPGLKTIDTADSCCVEVLGRLKPGAARASTQAELAILSAQFRESLKRKPSRLRLSAPTPMASGKAQSAALPWFIAMAVTAGLILLLACANVANLQIARVVSRRREIAVRLALGAGRFRVLRQLIVECLLLSSIAGAISVAIASWAPTRIVAAIAGETRLAIRFDTDYRVIGFIVAITVLTALISGLAPTSTVLREDVSRGLGQGGRTTAAGTRLRRVLLAVQVAFSAILLTGAMLLVRAAESARHHDPGFSHDRVVFMTLGLDSSGANDELSRDLIAALMARIAALPGVESVAHSVAPAFGRTNMGMGIPDPKTQGQFVIGFDRVSANFFDTLRVPLLAGAGLHQADEPRAATAVINQAAAERLWPGTNPMGRPLHPGSKIMIAGVAPNITVRQAGSEGSPFVWIAASSRRDSKLLIRHAPGAADTLSAALPAIAREQDSRFMATAVPYSRTVADGLLAANLAAGVAGLLGLLALLLASVGIYGVAAYDVSERTREIGLRIALGALPAKVLRMVIRDNLRVVAAGSAVGIAGAIGFAQLLKGLVYGVAPLDAAALSGAIGILAAGAMLATLAPARRASTIDPAAVLRQD